MHSPKGCGTAYKRVSQLETGSIRPFSVMCSHHIRTVLRLSDQKVYGIRTCTLTFESFPLWTLDPKQWVILFYHNTHFVCMNCDYDHFQRPPPEKVVLDVRALKATIAKNMAPLKMYEKLCPKHWSRWAPHSENVSVH